MIKTEDFVSSLVPVETVKMEHGGSSLVPVEMMKTKDSVSSLIPVETVKMEHSGSILVPVEMIKMEQWVQVDSAGNGKDREQGEASICLQTLNLL
jgi:hypothetical protein